MRRSTLVLCGCILAAVASTRWVRLNISPSVPYGLYRLRPVPATLPYGALVVVPAPASVQTFWPWWVRMLKPVAAVPGDTVCHVDDRLFVNGVDFGPVYETVHGQPLPHIMGCRTVQPGEVFVASQTPNSLDSRYFGPVLVAELTAMATPVLTW